MNSYALEEIDLKLRKYLSINDGFYIECGANDGITQSNTFAYEQLGWSGLLVEPCPINYSKCVRNRPRSIVENYALVSSSYNKNTISGFFDNSCYNGLMATLDDYPPSMDQERIKCHKEFANKFGLRPKEVPCRTLQSLIDKHRISHVDFFSLDVEGYEIEVLNGLDFNIIRPKYILIEVTESQENQKKILEYMSSIGYDNIEKVSINDVLFIDGKI